MQTRNSRWPISFVLAAFYTISAFVILSLASMFLYLGLSRELELEKREALADQVEIVRVVIKEHPDDIKTLKWEIEGEGTTRRFAQYYARILDQDGNVLMESPDMERLSLSHPVFPPPVSVGEKPEKGTHWKSPDGKWFLLMSARVGSEHPRLLELALDITAEKTVLNRYREKLLQVLVLGIICSALVGIWITRKGLRPLAEITEATQKINATQLHERIIPEKWPRELAALATAFDEMLGRLEASFNRLSQFSADVAHEFRTPIASLRLQAEVALTRSRTVEEYRAILESSLEDYERLSQMVEKLLFLARSENAETVLNRSTISPRKEIKSIGDFYEAMLAEKKIALDIEGDGTLEADVILFQRAINNLLANAIRHTPANGKITARIRPQENGGTAIEVTDNGCGFAPEHIPKIFDRFYRIDKSRNSEQGTGLGLSIVKTIMDLHGGAVRIQSEVGKGSTVILVFPARFDNDKTVTRRSSSG